MGIFRLLCRVRVLRVGLRGRLVAPRDGQLRSYNGFDGYRVIGVHGRTRLRLMGGWGSGSRNPLKGRAVASADLFSGGISRRHLIFGSSIRTEIWTCAFGAHGSFCWLAKLTLLLAIW